MPAWSLPRNWTRQGWTAGRLLAGLILMVLAVLATADAWSDLVTIGLRDEEASHIILVPIVAAWLVWVRRERLRHCPSRGHLFGPFVCAVGWFLYSFGDLHLIQAFWHAGAVIVVMGCFLSVAGTEVFFRFFPAFAVLAFLVPVPGMIRQEVAIPLQTATADVTQKVMEVIGIAVERTGSALVINGKKILIAEACNGLRMVTALFLVSIAFAYGTPLRWYARFLIVALSPVSAILCNVIRLVPTVWLYGNYPDHVAKTFHDLSGWIMLPVSFLILMGVIRALRWALVPVHRYTLAYGA